MKMDVSKFKKVSSDGKKTILKHPRGHEIVIAHSAVSPSTRKQLSLLPGMDRNPNEKSLSAMPGTYQERGPGTDFSNVNNMPRMANGGGVGSETQLLAPVPLAGRQLIGDRVVGQTWEVDQAGGIIRSQDRIGGECIDWDADEQQHGFDRVFAGLHQQAANPNDGSDHHHSR